MIAYKNSKLFSFPLRFLFFVRHPVIFWKEPILILRRKNNLLKKVENVEKVRKVHLNSFEWRFNMSWTSDWTEARPKEMEQSTKKESWVSTNQKENLVVKFQMLGEIGWTGTTETRLGRLWPFIDCSSDVWVKVLLFLIPVQTAATATAVVAAVVVVWRSSRKDRHSFSDWRHIIIDWLIFFLIPKPVPSYNMPDGTLAIRVS